MSPIKNMLIELIKSRSCVALVYFDSVIPELIKPALLDLTEGFHLLPNIAGYESHQALKEAVYSAFEEAQAAGKTLVLVSPVNIPFIQNYAETVFNVRSFERDDTLFELGKKGLEFRLEKHRGQEFSDTEEITIDA